MISLSVALLSGRSVALQLPEELPVSELKQIAQQQLGRSLVLLSPQGQRLEGLRSLSSLQLEGQVVSAVSKPGPVIHSNRKASTFAAIKKDGQLVAWGHKFHGGRGAR